MRWYSNTGAWRNRRGDADADALLKKLVVDADAGARRFVGAMTPKPVRGEVKP